jgi:hypothetical protein
VRLCASVSCLVLTLLWLDLAFLLIVLLSVVCLLSALFALLYIHRWLLYFFPARFVRFFLLSPRHCDLPGFLGRIVLWQQLMRDE